MVATKPLQTCHDKGMKQINKPSAGRPKSVQKRYQILESAAHIFMQHGYERASMDSVAKESGVSKQTVYSHFKSKDALFSAVIERKCESYQIDQSAICQYQLPLNSILKNFAIKFIQLLSDDDVISMYNAVIGEAQNAPHVAQLFYEAGPVHSIELIQHLLQAHPESRLSAELAKEASVDFFNLLKGEFHMRSLLHLPFKLDEATIEHKASRTAQKIVLIIEQMLQKNLPKSTH